MARRNALIMVLALLGSGPSLLAGPASAADASVDVPDASGYFPDKPGEWQYRPEHSKVREVGLGPAASKALIEKMDGIMAVLAEPAVFHPPIGFQARAYTNYRGRICAEPGITICSEGPADASNAIIFYYFVDDGDGKASWGGEANSSVELGINSIAGALGSPGAPADGDAFLPDGRRIVLRPREVARLDGIPLLESTHGAWSMTLAKPGLPLWLPVSRQQYLEALVRALEKSLPAISADMANPADPYAAWLAERPKREQGVRESYEAIKMTDPVQADQFLEMSKRIEAETGAQMQAMKSAPADPGGMKPMEDALDTFRAQLAQMSGEERALPAYYIHPDASRDGPFASGLVPEGTPDSIQLVAVNPQLVDRRRPPEEIQLITVFTHFGGNRVSNQRLEEFLKTVGWSRVASFLR